MKKGSKKLTEREVEVIIAAVDNEGLDYAIHFYDSYDHGTSRIENKEFHKLRKKLIEARDALETFLKKNGVDCL